MTGHMGTLFLSLQTRQRTLWPLPMPKKPKPKPKKPKITDPADNSAFQPGKPRKGK